MHLVALLLLFWITAAPSLGALVVSAGCRLRFGAGCGRARLLLCGAITWQGAATAAIGSGTWLLALGCGKLLNVGARRRSGHIRAKLGGAATASGARQLIAMVVVVVVVVTVASVLVVASNIVIIVVVVVGLVVVVSTVITSPAVLLCGVTVVEVVVVAVVLSRVALLLVIAVAVRFVVAVGLVVLQNHGR